MRGGWRAGGKKGALSVAGVSPEIRRGRPALGYTRRRRRGEQKAWLPKVLESGTRVVSLGDKKVDWEESYNYVLY